MTDCPECGGSMEIETDKDYRSSPDGLWCKQSHPHPPHEWMLWNPNGSNFGPMYCAGHS